MTAFHQTQDPITKSDGWTPVLGTTSAGMGVQRGAMVRRLTPLECERLQGFPDGWTEPLGADSRRYAALGDAVTVNVAEWLGRRLMTALEQGEAA